MHDHSNSLFCDFPEPSLVLDPSISTRTYISIDLSDSNTALKQIDITNPMFCQQYIDYVLAKNNAHVAYGGYLEKRSLYANSSAFKVPGQPERKIHLGLDFWTNAGTAVLAPVDGVVHSYANNISRGDYGPTIILMHRMSGKVLYTLYGHLALASIVNVHPGDHFKKGEVIGTLGTPEVNGNYAPHLHFQLIRDLGGWTGDYPGVCSIKEIGEYKENCPNPALLAKVN